MDKEPQPANATALKAGINPVLVYCIIGAVVAFNIILYLYVMDRLNQLDKEKAELLNSIKQYQEVPLPDLMKDPESQANERIEGLNRIEKELNETNTESKEASKETSKKPQGTSVPEQSAEPDKSAQPIAN